jgi:GDP-mannose pyrophosphatase NudK
MAAITIEREEILSDEKYVLKRVQYSMQNSEGKEVQQTREVYHRGNAVAALLYNPEARQVLLTRQFRLPAYLNGHASGFLMEACAGLVEEGEQEDDTMLREIREEMGYEVTGITKVHKAYSSAGALTECIHLYLAPFHPSQKKNDGGGLKSEGEDIELVELSYDEAFEMLARGSFEDAKTIILLQHLRMMHTATEAERSL